LSHSTSPSLLFIVADKLLLQKKVCFFLHFYWHLIDWKFIHEFWRNHITYNAQFFCLTILSWIILDSLCLFFVYFNKVL
jgi:hypothetical protein